MGSPLHPLARAVATRYAATGSSPNCTYVPGAVVPNQGPRTMAVIWSLVGLSAAFLIARILIKYRRFKSLWWDDWVLIISWILFSAYSALSQVVVDLGFGKYPCDIDPHNLFPIGLIGNIGDTCGIFAMVWSKTSFAITLLRITEGKIKAFVWFAIVSMNIAVALTGIIHWVQCSPAPTLSGSCWGNQFRFGLDIFTSLYSGVMDFALALLPWKIVWSLQMRLAEKIGVAIAMSMGLFAGTTAFVKIFMVPVLTSDNYTYGAALLILWGAAEIGTTIMAACIPVLRALLGNSQRSRARQRERGFSSWSAPAFWHRFGVEGGIKSSRESQQNTVARLQSLKPTSDHREFASVQKGINNPPNHEDPNKLKSSQSLRSLE